LASKYNAFNVMTQNNSHYAIQGNSGSLSWHQPKACKQITISVLLSYILSCTISKLLQTTAQCQLSTGVTVFNALVQGEPLHSRLINFMSEN